MLFRQRAAAAVAKALASRMLSRPFTSPRPPIAAPRDCAPDLDNAAPRTIEDALALRAQMFSHMKAHEERRIARMMIADVRGGLIPLVPRRNPITPAPEIDASALEKIMIPYLEQLKKDVAEIVSEIVCEELKGKVNSTILTNAPVLVTLIARVINITVVLLVFGVGLYGLLYPLEVRARGDAVMQALVGSVKSSVYHRFGETMVDRHLRMTAEEEEMKKRKLAAAEQTKKKVQEEMMMERMKSRAPSRRLTALERFQLLQRTEVMSWPANRRRSPSRWPDSRGRGNNDWWRQ